MLRAMSSTDFLTDSELRARLEQLEIDRDTMYAAFRAVNGECHEVMARHRADRMPMVALRTTQIEHGQVLGGLVVDVSGLKHDVSELKSDVSELKNGQSRLERLIRRGLKLPDED
jgi:hypothetical protein